MTLYELLQDQVMPLYYGAATLGYSPDWVRLAKQSITTLLPRFNSTRMVTEYWPQDLPAGRPPGAPLRRERVRRRAEGGGLEGAGTCEAGTACGRAGSTCHRTSPSAMACASGGCLRRMKPEDVVVEVIMGRPPD